MPGNGLRVEVFTVFEEGGQLRKGRLLNKNTTHGRIPSPERVAESIGPGQAMFINGELYVYVEPRHETAQPQTDRVAESSVSDSSAAVETKTLTFGQPATRTREQRWDDAERAVGLLERAEQAADRMFERHEKLMNLHEHRATRQLEREQEINALHDRRKAELEAWRRKHEDEIDSRVTQINKAAGDLAEMLKQAPQKIEQKQLPPASERADEFDRVYARAQLNPIQAIGALLVGLHEAYVDATAYPGGSR